MAIAFSSIPVWRLSDMPDRDGVLIPSKFACLFTDLSGTYKQENLPIPYCWENADEIPEPPDAESIASTKCIYNPKAPTEPQEGDTDPCGFPWYPVPAEPLVLDFYYSGAQKGQTYSMAIYVFEYAGGNMEAEPDSRTYPFEFTATGESGKIESAFEIIADEDRMCCCYVGFGNCDIGE